LKIAPDKYRIEKTKTKELDISKVQNNALPSILANKYNLTTAAKFNITNNAIH
jgi:hypothetical protein